jgi:hypothetical protein
MSVGTGISGSVWVSECLTAIGGFFFFFFFFFFSCIGGGIELLDPCSSSFSERGCVYKILFGL